MKTGRSITDLAKEIQRQTIDKKDFNAPSNLLTATNDGKITLEGHDTFEINNNAHGQFAARLGIPKKYYDKMYHDAPELWAKNMNHWLVSNPEKRLIRTLDGKVRAFLSNGYRTLDNFELLEAVLPLLQSRSDVQIESCEVTEDRLYLKVFFNDLEQVVTGSSLKNDIVRVGLCISNSEVGNGSLSVQPMTYRLVCTNGMISSTATRKYHTGRKGQIDMNEIQAILSDKTKQVSDAAFWLQVQDIIKHNLKPETIAKEMQKFEEATQRIIGDDMTKIELVENTIKHFDLREGQKEGILENLLRDGDYSQWGLANAVTNHANSQGDYEEATKLEKIGGKIIELNNSEWKRLAA